MLEGYWHLLLAGIVLLSSSYVFGATQLMELYPNSVKSSLPSCRDLHLLSCTLANVNIPVLHNSSVSLSSPTNLTLVKKNSIVTGGDSVSVAFKNMEDERDECVFTFMMGHLYASCQIQSRYYIIRNCGLDCHVWIEMDSGNLPEGEDGLSMPDQGIFPRLQSKLAEGSEDKTTLVTYSIMFYYTAPFANKVGDVSTWIDQAIAVTNQGYINSQMPIQATKGCLELSQLEELKDPSQMLMAFTYSKNTGSIRRSFDVAALLVDKLGSCGIAWYNSIPGGSPFVVAKESCVLGYYSFGHEIGHTFGAKHNPEITSNLEYPWGHAHLIDQGVAKTGARTILAYNANGHFQRVNYYSNPNVIYPTTKTPTGVAGLSNNAAVIVGNRIAMAALGDESEISSCDAVSGSGSGGESGAISGCTSHYCKLGDDHTMCKFPEPKPTCDIKTSGFPSQRVINAIVEKHNLLRRKILKGEETRGSLGAQPHASNMKKLVWDEELATIAQRWADQCDYGRDDNRKVERFGWIGQNGLWRSSPNDFVLDATVAVQKWYDEVARFPGTVAPFNQSGSTGVTGHYSQVAWADTDLVGCGSTKYYKKDSQNKYNILVFCNYGLGGNTQNSDMYRIGAAGSQCPVGYSPQDGLCAKNSPFQPGYRCGEVQGSGGGETGGSAINNSIPTGPGWFIPEISGKSIKGKAVVCSHPVNIKTKFRRSKICKDNSGKEYMVGNFIKKCCYIYTCIKFGKRDLKWKYAFLSNNCCKYLGKNYLSGQAIVTENLDECSAQVLKCNKNDGWPSQLVKEVRHGYCCSYDNKVKPIGSALPLLESCSQLTCQDGSSGPTFLLRRVFGSSGCCWHQGKMLEDGVQVIVKGVLATCCRGTLVAPV